MVLIMNQKKRWLCKVYNSQENKTGDITWTSSESDDSYDDLPPPKKILNESVNNYIALNKTPPQSIENCNIDSPILSNVSLEESPVLTQSDVSYFKEQSPVIGHNAVLKRIKSRKELKIEEIEIEVINDSPTQSSSVEVEISPIKSPPSQPYQIEPFPSQHGSEVTSSINSQQLLYHEPPPKKERFKKGGLADQLQKAINLETSSTAIWEHEMFLNRSNNERDDKNEFQFQAIDKWTEYGCILIECKYNNADIFRNLDIENRDFFILIVNFNNPLSSWFQIGKSYQIFPPYSKIVSDYKCKKTLFIVRASRFLSL